MQPSKVKNQLIALTAVAGLAVFAIATWAFWNSNVELDSNAGFIAASSSSNSLPDSPDTLLDFSTLGNMALRGPRVTSARTEAAPVVQAPAPQNNFSIKLVGTVVEANRSLGLFQDSAGAFDVKATGEFLKLSPNGVTIEKIEPGAATVRWSGKNIRLVVLSGQSAATSPQPGQTTSIDDGLEASARMNMADQVAPPTSVVQPPVPVNGGMEHAPSGSEDIFDIPANMNVYDMSNYGSAGAPPSPTPAP
jgi:hypothetical protein